MAENRHLLDSGEDDSSYVAISSESDNSFSSISSAEVVVMLMRQAGGGTQVK